MVHHVPLPLSGRAAGDRALQLLLVAYRLASAEHFNNDALVEVFKTGIFPLLLVRPFGS